MKTTIGVFLAVFFLLGSLLLVLGARSNADLDERLHRAASAAGERARLQAEYEELSRNSVSSATLLRRAAEADEAAQIRALIEQPLPDSPIDQVRKIRPLPVVQLPPGFESVSSLANEGNALPLSLQHSLFWAMSQGDIKTLSSYIQIPPALRSQLLDMQANYTQEQRDSLGSPEEQVAGNYAAMYGRLQGVQTGVVTKNGTTIMNAKLYTRTGRTLRVYGKLVPDGGGWKLDGSAMAMSVLHSGTRPVTIRERPPE